MKKNSLTLKNIILLALLSLPLVLPAVIFAGLKALDNPAAENTDFETPADTTDSTEVAIGGDPSWSQSGRYLAGANGNNLEIYDTVNASSKRYDMGTNVGVYHSWVSGDQRMLFWTDPENDNVDAKIMSFNIDDTEDTTQSNNPALRKATGAATTNPDPNATNPDPNNPGDPNNSGGDPNNPGGSGGSITANVTTFLQNSALPASTKNYSNAIKPESIWDEKAAKERLLFLRTVSGDNAGDLWTLTFDPADKNELTSAQAVQITDGLQVWSASWSPEDITDAEGNPTGVRAVDRIGVLAASGNIYVLNGIQDIIAGTTGAITSLGDSRAQKVTPFTETSGGGTSPGGASPGGTNPDPNNPGGAVVSKLESTSYSVRGAPGWSRDGKWIGVSASEGGMNDNNVQIKMYILDSTAESTMDAFLNNEFYPETNINKQWIRWSPDGTQLAYSRSEIGGGGAMVIMPMVTVTTLTENLRSGSDPGYSSVATSSSDHISGSMSMESPHVCGGDSNDSPTANISGAENTGIGEQVAHLCGGSSGAPSYYKAASSKSGSYTIKVHYNDSEIEGYNEQSLQLYEMESRSKLTRLKSKVDAKHNIVSATVSKLSSSKKKPSSFIIMSHTIRGEISGKSARNSSITLFRYSPKYGLYQKLNSTTPKNGKYAFSKLTAGKYKLKQGTTEKTATLKEKIKKGYYRVDSNMGVNF